MRRKKEDKIIKMLNENVDIDLNENYHNTLAKIRESNHTYEEKPFRYRKGLSIGLLALTLIIFSLKVDISFLNVVLLIIESDATSTFL